jgi:hypothetical protein
MIRKLCISGCVLIFCLGELAAQSPSNIDSKILYRKEWSAYLLAHTGGWGLGYRSGRHKTGYVKRMWEVEFISMKHPKEKKVTSWYENTRSFIFGKMNSFYMVQGGYGMQRILNSKPYWGGVELRWFMYGGGSLGITKPMYLYIVKYNEEQHRNEVVTERYDPDRHSVDDIYGRGPYFKGFDKIKLYPGAYAKTGLNFEYGSADVFLRSIECGAALNYYPIAVPIMAFNDKNSFFLSLYLSLHFGKRKN